jgi:hypothetical protein
MHMLNRDGSRLFSPIKTMIAAALLLMGIVALTVLIVITYLSVTATVAKAAEPAPIIYDALYYRPTKDSLCPGLNPTNGLFNTLDFTPTVTIRSAGRIDILRTFWDRTFRHVARLPNNSTPAVHDQFNLPFELAGESSIAVSHVTLPNLPEGDYWMVTSVIGVNTNQVQYQVAFSVPQGCPPVTVPLPPPVIDDLSTFWIPTKPER